LSRGAGRDPLEIMTDAAHFGETKPSGLSAPLTSPPVIAGLDPVIHRFERIAFSMDARVISAFTRVFDALLPAHDGSRTATQAAAHFGETKPTSPRGGSGLAKTTDRPMNCRLHRCPVFVLLCPVIQGRPPSPNGREAAPISCFHPVSYGEAAGAGLYPRFLFSSVIYRARAFTDKTSSRATLELLLQKSSLKPCGPTP
jgi:hypothetical protein